MVNDPITERENTDAAGLGVAHNAARIAAPKIIRGAQVLAHIALKRSRMALYLYPLHSVCSMLNPRVCGRRANGVTTWEPRRPERG